MDANRKKELLLEYKNRKPDMGIIAFKCKETLETFLGISTDTKADFNSNKVKLKGNCHPNKRLQQLWTEFGIDGFEICVLEPMPYDDKAHDTDYKANMEARREVLLTTVPKANKIWL